jgi:hypothetical protein
MSAQGIEAAASGGIGSTSFDEDRDALHILPISLLPVEHALLRRTRMIKNARLDGVVELFNSEGSGSGQFDVKAVAKLLNLQRTPTHPDVALLMKVSSLPSFDAYSLRILLRASGIPISDAAGLSLSPTKVRSLSAYMASFTRPLVAEIFGADTSVDHFSDIIGLFRNTNGQTARERLQKMADKLGLEIMAIPNFLEDYGDIFMSLSYYRQCLDEILPNIQSFMDSLSDIRENYQLRQDTNLMATIATVEETINSHMANITGRLESFERATNDMWRDLTADRFRKIETLISSNRVAIAGVLCALSVKMNAWKRQFPRPAVSGPVRRAAFIMSDMREGLDRIRAIEDATVPILSALND